MTSDCQGRVPAFTSLSDFSMIMSLSADESKTCRPSSAKMLMLLLIMPTASGELKVCGSSQVVLLETSSKAQRLVQYRNILIRWLRRCWLGSAMALPISP